jgi:hypothetical protein
VTLYQCDGVRDDGMACGTKDAELCGKVERERRKCREIGTYIRIDAVPADVQEIVDELQLKAIAYNSPSLTDAADLLLAEAARADMAEAEVAKAESRERQWVVDSAFIATALDSALKRLTAQGDSPYACDFVQRALGVIERYADTCPLHTKGATE